MKHLPTGRVRLHDEHRDLVYTRVLPRGRDDVWQTLTGGTPLGSIEVTVVSEDEPDHLTVRLDSGTVVDGWLRVRDEDSTDLQLVVHGVDLADLGERGPRGDFLAGVLAARVAGEHEPAWEDYYPAGRAYYETLAADDAPTEE
ncbi:hypothetical protein FE697_015555 [Mumia zhuanghuii]|uniref:Activator of Hsp90 ATPase homolog 1-like protein n=2 Tax=Mumia TaxID=1546255 RepID=A0ABW1QQW7_9ACTN|nr:MULTISPECIES: hypothetical protein [Mumia]KAA1420383.1 hypothetical protein FE697_015555 [Mumia zhuanghuii]